MAKTITLRIDEEKARRINAHAQMENRTMSNFLETAALKYIEREESAGEFEMSEILSDGELMKRLKKGSLDARKRRGRFAGI